MIVDNNGFPLSDCVMDDDQGKAHSISCRHAVEQKAYLLIWEGRKEGRTRCKEKKPALKILAASHRKQHQIFA